MSYDLCYHGNVREMAIEVGKIWNDADCCPYSRNHIITLFEKEVWSVYKYVLREKCLPSTITTTTTPTTPATDSTTPAKKRSHKKDPSKPRKYGSQPRRKSSHLDSTSSSLPSDDVNVTELPPQVRPLAAAPSVKVNTRSSVEYSLTLEWGKEGKKLFDVKSERKVME